MAKIKIRPVVHTHDGNAKVEFCVERGAGDFPTLIDVTEFYSVCQETADAFCTAAEAEEVMGIVQQALADTRPVESVPVVHSEWISVRDKLPESDADVLITNGKWCDVGFYSNRYSAWRSYDTINGSVIPTHWMPLPELPKEDA